MYTLLKTKNEGENSVIYEIRIDGTIIMIHDTSRYYLSYKQPYSNNDVNLASSSILDNLELI